MFRTVYLTVGNCGIEAVDHPSASVVRNASLLLHVHLVVILAHAQPALTASTALESDSIENLALSSDNGERYQHDKRGKSPILLESAVEEDYINLAKHTPIKDNLQCGVRCTQCN